ncbi:MAG: hypothetical protein ACR2IP_01890 [Solirubrobacteraceae bacterium]
MSSEQEGSKLGKAVKGFGQRTRYGVTHEGHDVEVEFDRRNPMMDAARLLIDGELVDKKRMFYGEKDLTTTASDGTEIMVAVEVGGFGELTRAQARGPDGSWIDLQEREPQS